MEPPDSKPKGRVPVKPVVGGLVVLALVLVAALSMAPAGKPVRVERPGFRVSVPGNWVVDEEPKLLFARAPDRSAEVRLWMFEERRDPATQAAALRPDFERVRGKITPFRHWASLDGDGLELAGQFQQGPGHSRKFFWTDGQRSLDVMEGAVDGHGADEAFALMRSTFELTPPKP